MYFRKFYDVAVPEAPATSGGIDVAAIMAKSGLLTQQGSTGEIPKINTAEQKEEKPATSAAPAPATQPSSAEKEPKPAKPTETQPVATPQTAEPSKAQSWQEVLKQQQPNAILKELGYDDSLVAFLNGRKQIDPKMVGFVNHWESNNGEVGPYLRALSTDFSKMPPEDVMRYQLQVQNPELDAKQLDTLYKIKVVNRYKIDPVLFSEEEAAEGRIELIADAKPVRNQLATEQQQYLFPKPPEKTLQGPDPQVVQRQQEADAYKAHIDNDPYTRQVMANKSLSFGQGDDKFDYPVEPQQLMSVLYDPDQWAQHLFIERANADGTKSMVPDVEKQFLLAGIAVHGKAFLDAYAKHYKTLGGKSVIAPIENAKPPAAGTPAQAEAESNDPAAVMAKRGRITRGGE